MNEALVNQAMLEKLSEQGMGMAVLAASLPDKPAIISSAGNRSFSELNANANKLVRYFRHKGAKAGDGIAVLSSNGPELIEIIYACLRGGFRVTPVNWHQTSDDIAYVVDNCEAKIFLTWGGRFDEASQKAVEGNDRLLGNVAFSKPVTGFENYDDILQTYSGENITDPVSGNLMLYTSGTTGKPKGVYRKKRALTSALGTKINDTAEFDPATDVCLVTGPLYHSAPLAINLMMPLAKGVTCVLMDQWDAEETLQLIQQYKVTFMHLVPTMFQRFLALPDSIKQKYDISSLRYVVHGAAPCPVHIKQAAMEWLGPIIYEYYAATEGGHIYCEPEQWLSKPGTVGTPAEGMGVKILDETGQPVPAGVDGTIFLEAPDDPEVKFSYFGDTGKTTGSYRDNYFTMGDIGHLDSDGFLFLTGRSAELVICGGVNIYPAQIDEVLSRHPDIADVATIGVTNEEFGEEIKAVVELRNGAIASDELCESILDFGKQNLTGFMRPRTVEFVDKVPRSEGGKILRRLLRDQYNKK